MNKKNTLISFIDSKILPALELAIDGDDTQRINNIMEVALVEIYNTTGVWYKCMDYHREYGDNLNGYISHLIHIINEVT